MLKPCLPVFCTPGKTFCLLIICLFFLSSSFAQTILTGRVTSVTNDSVLNAVSVQVKGANAGTTSDDKGIFSIRVTLPATLTFTRLGYQTKEVTINNDQEVIVRMEVTSEQSLDQVVVVAYGTQKKATITGAIASIQTREIKQSPAANLAVTLAGRLPGLTAVQRSGEPGRDITQLFIRGRGTVNAQSPIILVDGVERDLTYIDPNEVESVTILKDASSTAIFGVRGANGVILVTTRRGTSEKPEISFSSEYGLQDLTRFPHIVNSYQFATLRNLAQNNDGLGDAFSEEALAHYKNGDDPVRYPNTDWKNMNVKDFSNQQRYNLNISGGTKTVKYFVNAGFLNQGGQFKTENGLPYDPSFFLKRYNFRSNIDIQLNKSLKAFLNVAGYLEKQNMPFGVFGALPGDINANLANISPALFVLASIFNMPATVPGPLTPDGEIITSNLEANPVYGQLNRTGYIQQTRSNVTATYGMDQSLDFITKGLSARAVLSFDSRTTNNLFASKTYSKFVQVIDPNQQGQDGEDSVYFRQFNNDQNSPLNLSGGRAFTTLSNLQAYLNYNRTFGGKHSFTGLVLYQQQQSLIDAQLPFNLRGISSRLTYAYDNKYFAEFNAGYNGSEQFAKGKRFGFFPAYSAGWLVSNENFLKNNKIITQLKVRGSYGKVGNDRLSNLRFLYLDDIQVVGGGYTPSLDFGSRINENLLRNEALQWEVAKKANVGLELGLLRSINLTVDVFTEKRDNVLRTRGTVPVLNGLPVGSLPPVNIGRIENKGFEIELNYRKAFTRDFSILGKVNVNYAHNKQLFADEPLLPEDYAYRYRQTGYSIGQPFGYIVDGYFASQDDIDKSPKQAVPGHESRPGDFKYKDLNNDGVVNEKDQSPIGYSNVPEYNFGAALNVTFRNIDVSILFQGVTNVYNFYQGFGSFNATYNNYVNRNLESWTPERAAANDPITYPRLTTQSSPNEINNSFFIINASYIRLKNAEIGYTLPLKWSKAIGSNRIRFYANGLNLVTWDKLPTKDFDPELTDGLSYPLTRLYNLGVNITF